MFSEYSIPRVSVPGQARSPQAGAAHSTSAPKQSARSTTSSSSVYSQAGRKRA